jgi:vitamin B12 transporter
MKFRSNRNWDKSALIFKKWTRKRYSVFATMRKVVNISVLTVTYFLSAPVTAVSIPADTTDIKMEYDLEEIEVTASRVPVLFSQVARVLSVIEAKDIEQMPAESVQDLLEYMAGVDIRQRGAEGVQADISIRGGTFDQTLILLNGMNITDPQTGHHNLNLPVSLSQIERIEILEGPAARVYGPNAFSGAINIITKKPQSESISAQFSAGSFNYMNTSLSGSLRTGKLSHLIAASRKSSSGYTENTDFKNSNIYYSGEHISGAGKLFYQGGIAEKSFGANSFYTPKYPNQFEEVQIFMGSLRFESKTQLNLTPSIYWRRHADKFMLFRENPPDWYKNHNFHRTDSWGADLNSWFVWKGGKTSLGAGYRSESILSNVLGMPMAEAITFPGKEVFYTHSKDRVIASVFAEHSFLLEKWRLTAGLMANHISDNEEGINFFPGFELSYQVFQPLKMIASWNTSLRMPTFTDLYYKGPTNLGNPDLKPERSAALEGGFKLNNKFVKGHLVLFYRKGNNLIDWIKTNDDELWKSMNHTEIRSRGIQVNLLYFPSLHLSSKMPERIELSGMYNRQNKEESPYISYYVLDNLRYKFVASVTQPLINRVSLNLNAVYQNREGTFTFYGGVGNTYEKEYSPFWTVDAKLTCDIHPFKLFVSANNLLNRQYYDIENVIQPGRWIKAGVSLNIKGAE